MFDQEENLLLKYANKIRNQSHFQKILERQDMTFDYKPYKIGKLSPEKALIIYQNLRHRYNDSKQLTAQAQGWHEYEKRLFVWFMVIYAYYLQKEYSTLESPTDYKQKINFNTISRIFFGKSPWFLEFQFLNLFKVTDKVTWTEKDDSLLTDAVKLCVPGRWTQVSIQIFMSSGREKFICSKNCRQRWLNHLDKSKVKGNWTFEEDRKIIEYVAEKGKKWSKMKVVLENKRTEHMIKNRYHSLITRNKVHRYEKEHQISRRLVEKFEGMQKSQMIEAYEQNNQCDTQQLERQNQITINLKQQDLSKEQQQKTLPLPPFSVEDNEEMVKQQEINEKVVQDVGQADQLDPAKNVQVKVEAQAQEIYPFQNYNQYCGYNSYDQFFEFQNAQYRILCQQYMYNGTAPTNDTYVAENPNVQSQPPQGQGPRDA